VWESTGESRVCHKELQAWLHQCPIVLPCTTQESRIHHEADQKVLIATRFNIDSADSSVIMKLTTNETHNSVHEPQAANEMIEILFTAEESPEGGFIAKAVGHSIFTEADTLEELRGNVREAVETHFDAGERPRLVRLHIVRDEVLTL
jgi:predicted RNase H-like HicB family nuclease